MAVLKHHDIDFSVQEEAKRPDGGTYWRTATPLPLFIRKWPLVLKWYYQCECGDVFKSMEEYRIHYRFAVKLAGIDERTA